MARHKSKDNQQWIQKAVRKPGALRRTAKRLGLIKGDQSLSQSDLNDLEAHARKRGDTTLLRRVNLARTLKRLRGS